eukprot:CAMPEP_0204036408 /NCGR_PEP_ID=MMETSP0360-20130528/79676_1 /ASSEMBLY_ACC=CAM_ASM_000342 /TAXON_ID=268821 /ORGANISM="Scrippsiella Hangoei, Strain SHTV-5" /LENGTH=296 /DNA_ID=CAMNT_0050981607 /DNA_START=36 /DNA_END=922 /DNA_ORIENTATION=+
MPRAVSKGMGPSLDKKGASKVSSAQSSDSMEALMDGTSHPDVMSERCPIFAEARENSSDGLQVLQGIAEQVMAPARVAFDRRQDLRHIRFQPWGPMVRVALEHDVAQTLDNHGMLEEDVAPLEQRWEIMNKKPFCLCKSCLGAGPRQDLLCLHGSDMRLLVQGVRGALQDIGELLQVRSNPHAVLVLGRVEIELGGLELGLVEAHPALLAFPRTTGLGGVLLPQGLHGTGPLRAGARASDPQPIVDVAAGRGRAGRRAAARRGRACRRAATWRGAFHIRLGPTAAAALRQRPLPNG